MKHDYWYEPACYYNSKAKSTLYYLCPLVLRWDQFQVKAVTHEVNWRLWPLRSPIAAVHTELAGCPVVNTGFSTTNLQNSSHSASLLSVSRLILMWFGVVLHAFPLAVDFQGPAVWYLGTFGWNPLASSSKSSSLWEKSKRSSEVVLNTFSSSTKERCP